MERRLRSAASRTAARIGIGCVLGAATLTGASMASPDAALAACVNHHVNVSAYDAGHSNAHGNQGFVYVNTSSTLSGLHAAIGRTLLVYADSQTSNVEFGWTDHNGNVTSPTPASDYMVNSMTQPPHIFSGQTLHYNTSVSFLIENVGDRGIYRYVLAQASSPIGYSPTMSFNGGWPVTNSEHYNSCDSLWTDMNSLQAQTSISPETWSTTYANLGCWVNNSVNDWYLHRISNGDARVNQTVGGWGNNCSAA